MRIYGPVPSRRFGLSLGVDLVPHKTCSLDCIYCQLGPSHRTCAERSAFYSLETILRDVEEALEDGPRPDLVTMAGSGEPTLYQPLGELMDALHSLMDVPVLLITNSTMLWHQEVARAAMKADVLAPSLDAGDEKMFQIVNRPHPSITYQKMLEGLRAVTRAHPGEVALEVMLVRDINDDDASLKAIAEQLKHLRFDRIDVNTPVRPPVPERGALPCYRDVLERAIELFGPKAAAIGTFETRSANRGGKQRTFSDVDKDIKEILLRRPCTIDDVSSSLGLEPDVVRDSIERLTRAGLVGSRSGQNGNYFHVKGTHPTILRNE